VPGFFRHVRTKELCEQLQYEQVRKRGAVVLAVRITSNRYSRLGLLKSEIQRCNLLVTRPIATVEPQVCWS
jgi:hypothetical protein